MTRLEITPAPDADLQSTVMAPVIFLRDGLRVTVRARSE